MYFIKIQEGIGTKSTDTEYFVKLENKEKTDRNKLKLIYLSFIREYPHIVYVGIFLDRVHVANLAFRTKADIHNLWGDSEREEDLQEIIFGKRNQQKDKKFRHFHLGLDKISAKISLSALRTLVTIHFPTNWLLLLPETWQGYHNVLYKPAILQAFFI